MAPPAGLSRAELYRALQELEEVSPAPWSNAFTFALGAREREWVCRARTLVPTLLTQLLRTQRELMLARRQVARLEARLSESPAPHDQERVLERV